VSHAHPRSKDVLKIEKKTPLGTFLQKKVSHYSKR
jgi:hypothetical protein